MTTTIKPNLRGFSIINDVPKIWNQMDTNKITLFAGNIFSQFLSAIATFFGNLITSFNDILPSEQIRHWLQVATPYLIAAAVLICFICCFHCFISIFSCLFRGIYVLIKGLFSAIILVFMFVKHCLCCGGRSAVVMMKAPSMAGTMIARAVFEANTQAYFAGLCALSR